MGGRNHQPTSPDITPTSAWLSRQIGEGIIAIQQANNYLEEAIIIALERRHIEDLVPANTATPAAALTSSIGALSESLAALQRIDIGFNRIAIVAEKVGYTGNPLARSVRTFDLDAAFTGRLLLPNINRSVWDELLRHIEQENILGALEWERLQFRCLRNPTHELIASTEGCREIAEKRGAVAFAAAVETNTIPLRQHYARVFSLWNHHDAMFLYSALVMTELFYRANGYSSLTEFDSAARNTRAA